MRFMKLSLVAGAVGVTLLSAAALLIDRTPAVAQAACDGPTTPFCNSTVPLPAGWKGPVFQLRQDYPAVAPSDQQPWLAFDPRTQPDAYIKSVLAYFYEGNLRPDVETSFDPKLNTVRNWYNAPWQDQGTNGREPVHGLTRERTSRANELAAGQSQQWNNYAVGFYNAPGAVVIGQMWKDHGHPNPAAAGSLPEGTVAAKLLFTTATVQQVPYLAGAPTWKVYVYANPNDPSPKPTSPRAVLEVRLLQIDIAVKDSRVASTTGWVFGTFVYGGGPGGPSGSGWTNVAPVGVMWGNDPGSLAGGPLKETWLNPAVHMPHVGFQGRLNGPVDNPSSSCLSCHATAESPAGQMIGADPKRWFQNVPSGTPFDPGRQSMDYSLQLAVGLADFQQAQKIKSAPTPTLRAKFLQERIMQDSRPPRDGGPLH
ncbi:MAG: hypothetical protein KKE02_24215 [Alphaproteobacteria bacterium]|nr:hypothetical protein [Alphaproteobacteria bacterium]MBU2154144.1 hypothetical protein [Alphaproteobacteria bacterium]MBU2307449.1 hypothetical protein [Alphaproteobacteria bacterium]MBU2361590.1 hypothetical protein [Alphaproteobacteria bacterium]